MGPIAPIAGRECGGCSVCCIVPIIDEPDIQKPGSTPCIHLDRGCGIYGERPSVCRKFYCGWRQLSDLGDEWRPDLSGVLIFFERSQNGPAVALTFMLFAEPFKVSHSTGFVQMVRNQALKGAKIFIGLPGPPGFRAKRVYIPTQPLQEAARTDIGWVETLIEQALRHMHRESFEPYSLIHA